MRYRPALALATAALALAACSPSAPAPATADNPKATLASCAAPAPSAPVSPAPSASAAPPCIVTAKRQVPAVMVSDFDKECVTWKSGKCTKSKKVFDEMEEKEPARVELCADTPHGPVCETVDDATFAAYEQGDVYAGPAPR